MNIFLRLLRVRQWTKNVFIIFPLIFSARFMHMALWLNCALAFMAFCFISSGMYIINDLVDIKRDRLHPRKSQRPLSSGQIGVPLAINILVVLLCMGLIICYTISVDLLYLALVYILLHSLYNLKTKNVVIMDVLTVAFGFQIRIWAGSVAIGILPSTWLQICVFVLALFMGFTKRRYEITALKDKAFQHRFVLRHYSSELLDQIINICSTLAIVFYSLYAISPDVVSRLNGKYDMLYSVAFVIYGIFRYLYLIHVRKEGDDPSEVLLTDAPIIINLILWISFVVIVIYFNHT